MGFPLLPFGILPVAALLGSWYFHLTGKGKKSLAVKCLCSLLFLLTACVALSRQGQFPPGHPVFWFLLCCVVADGLLEIRFVPGMLLFGLGHCILILWMLHLAPFTWGSVLLWGLCMFIAWVPFRKNLLPMGKGMAPFVLYAGFLSAIAAIGVPLSVTLGAALLPVSIGSTCFFISDLMVAKGFFRSNTRRQEIVLMILYWGALFLIPLVLWL